MSTMINVAAENRKGDPAPRPTQKPKSRSSQHNAVLLCAVHIVTMLYCEGVIEMSLEDREPEFELAVKFVYEVLTAHNAKLGDLPNITIRAVED